MINSRVVAIFLIIALAVGHIAVLKHLTADITELARHPVTGADRARTMRLQMQVLILADLALIAGLIFWSAMLAFRMREYRQIRGQLADARKALEIERTLSASDTRLHLMFETADIGALLLDDKGLVLSVNRKAAGLLELDRHRTGRQSFADFLAPQAGIRLEDLQPALQNDGPQMLNVTLRTAKGRDLETSIWFNSFEDVTGESLTSAFFQPLHPAGTATKSSALEPDIILVADDEELIRLLVKNMLVRMDYTPLLAADGEEALALYDKYRERIAGAVLDLIMPGLNGEETARRLWEKDPRLPILCCSGFTQEELVEDLEPGQLLRKPFSFEEFEQALKAALGKNAEP